MTTSKLPEWPEKPPFFANRDDATVYIVRERDAALARMEALVELVNDMHGGNGQSKDGKNWYERRDELLAACERKEAGK
jgi:hypothetical protein